MRTIAGLAALLCAVTWATAAHADEPAAADTAGWKAVAGGHGTGCATDATPYEFYVHEGDPKRLAIYFQGGGGCWNSRNCGLDGQKTFDNSIDDTDRPWLNKTVVGGILDAANPANPLREFTIVFAPYCTADVHLGARTERYETADGKRLDIDHHGLANAQGVSWVTEQSSIRRGSSSPAAAQARFAGVRVPTRASLHEGAGRGGGRRRGGYRTNRLAQWLELWGATRALKHDPLYRDLEVETANFEDFYSHAAPVPNLQLGQINSIEDGVQIFFLAQLGNEVKSLAPLLSANIADLRKSNPKLRTYTMPGKVHTVLTRPDFYTAKVDEVALSKWVDDLVNGRKAANVGDSLFVAGADRLQ